MKRGEIIDAMDGAGAPLCGIEWHDDPAVEAAWQAWIVAGRPVGPVNVEAGEGRGSFTIRLPSAPELE